MIIIIIFITIVFIYLINKKKNNIIHYKPKNYKYVESELENLDKLNIKNKVINAIQGCDKLAGKDSLYFYFKKKFKNQYSKYLPVTYSTFCNLDIELFYKRFKNNDKYYLKKNIQNKKGIYITKNLNEIEAKLNSDKFIIIQEEVINPYLINGYKVNLRMYLLIYFKNGKQNWYFLPEGKCLYTYYIYSKNNIEPWNNLTNLDVNLDIYNKNPFYYSDLKKKLTDIQFKKLNTNLTNLFKKIENVYYKELEYRFNKQNTCFQLFGLDILFTNKFDVFLLEINKGPRMKSFYHQDIVLRNFLSKKISLVLDL